MEIDKRNKIKKHMQGKYEWLVLEKLEEKQST